MKYLYLVLLTLLCLFHTHRTQRRFTCERKSHLISTEEGSPVDDTNPEQPSVDVQAEEAIASFEKDTLKEVAEQFFQKIKQYEAKHSGSPTTSPFINTIRACRMHTCRS